MQSNIIIINKKIPRVVSITPVAENTWHIRAVWGVGFAIGNGLLL